MDVHAIQVALNAIMMTTMDDFFCPDCRALHSDPAEAKLGFYVVCTECRIAAETLEALVIEIERTVAQLDAAA